MKKEEIPQDPSALEKLTKEVFYAIDDKGNYITSLSTGWEVKAKALDVAWNDIEKRLMDAKQKVLNNEASPLLFFMELRVNGYSHRCCLYRFLEMADKKASETGCI